MPAQHIYLKRKNAEDRLRPMDGPWSTQGSTYDPDVCNNVEMKMKIDNAHTSKMKQPQYETRSTVKVARGGAAGVEKSRLFSDGRDDSVAGGESCCFTPLT